MDFILLVAWLVLGLIVFGIVHKAFDITYFGCGGMFTVFFGCMAAVAVGFYFAASFIGWLITAVTSFIATYYKWILGSIVILGILGYLGGKAEDQDSNAEHPVEK